MRKRTLGAVVALAMLLAAAPAQAATPRLWRVYDDALAGAKYVNLTHTITPHIPVWSGFGPSAFAPAVDPTTGAPYRYDQGLGFEATRYALATDPLRTQLDPPADRARHGPVRPPARPAGALGARVRGDRRAARHLRRAAARRDLDRAPGPPKL